MFATESREEWDAQDAPMSWQYIPVPMKLFCSMGLVVQFKTEHARCIVQELLKSLQDLPVPSSNPEPGRSHVKGEGADFLLAEAADTLKAMQVCVHLHTARSLVNVCVSSALLGVSLCMTGHGCSLASSLVSVPFWASMES